MEMLRLHGFVDEKGELHVKMPEGFPQGEVEITVQLVDENKETPDELQPEYTLEEVENWLRPGGQMTGQRLAELLEAIGTTGWENIPDGQEFIKEQRRKRRERNQW